MALGGIMPSAAGVECLQVRYDRARFAVVQPETGHDDIVVAVDKGGDYQIAHGDQHLRFSHHPSQGTCSRLPPGGSFLCAPLMALTNALALAMPKSGCCAEKVLVRPAAHDN